jgi:hypothetical protein
MVAKGRKKIIDAKERRRIPLAYGVKPDYAFFIGLFYAGQRKLFVVVADDDGFPLRFSPPG